MSYSNTETPTFDVLKWPKEEILLMPNNRQSSVHAWGLADGFADPKTRYRALFQEIYGDGLSVSNYENDNCDWTA